MGKFERLDNERGSWFSFEVVIDIRGKPVLMCRSGQRAENATSIQVTWSRDTRY